MSEAPPPIRVAVRQDPEARDLPLPAYQTEGSAGLDLHAAVPEALEIPPGQIALVPTGLRVAIPVGYEIQVRPRSGLALKHGIAVLNSPGTIDSDYRGPLNIILMNLGEAVFRIARGDRIAQAVLARVERIAWQPVEKLEDSPRGDGGFGHTGHAASEN